MSVRGRHYTLMAAWLLLGIAAIALAELSRDKLIWLFWLLIPGAFLFGAYGMSLKCPACRKPIEKHPSGYWTPWVPRICRHCGRDLEARLNSSAIP